MHFVNALFKAEVYSIMLDFTRIFRQNNTWKLRQIFYYCNIAHIVNLLHYFLLLLFLQNKSDTQAEINLFISLDRN